MSCYNIVMIYRVKVKPGTSQEKVVENGEGELVVYLRAKAHDGEANKALIKVLSKNFKVAKTRITIRRGEKGRDKIIEVI